MLGMPASPTPPQPQPLLCSSLTSYKTRTIARKHAPHVRRIRHFGGTYAAGRSQGAIDIEEDDGVLDWAGLKRRVDGCGFGHGCGCCVGREVGCGGGFGVSRRRGEVKVDTLQGADVGKMAAGLALTEGSCDDRSRWVCLMLRNNLNEKDI